MNVAAEVYAMELLLAPAVRLVMPGTVSGELRLGRAVGKGLFSSPSPVCAEALSLLYLSPVGFA